MGELTTISDYADFMLMSLYLTSFESLVNFLASASNFLSSILAFLLFIIEQPSGYSKPLTDLEPYDELMLSYYEVDKVFSLPSRETTGWKPSLWGLKIGAWMTGLKVVIVG